MRLPKVERPELNILSRSQSMELIEALDGHWVQPIVTVALTTGMGLGEILGLKWSNVSLENATVRVSWSVSETKTAGLQFKWLKRAQEREPSLLALP